MQTHGSRDRVSSNNNNNNNNSTSSNNNHSSTNISNSVTTKNKRASGANSSTTLKSANKETRSQQHQQQQQQQQQGNDDGSPLSVMSNVLFSPIDDDHIDDQETMKVGKLIIDFECELEKEKQIENEQANNSANSNSSSKKSSCTTTSTSANAPSSSSSSFSFEAKASSSTNNNGCPSTNSGKSNQKSIGKLSISSTSNNGSTTTTSNSQSTTSNNNNNAPTNTRSVFKSSADERGELKMRITRETKPGKSEHKIVTSPNQKSPTSCSGSSNNLNCDEENSHESISKPTQSTSSISSTKECGTSTSIGTITEPECLGPCEPGTSVTLEGIVWQETEGGILVVNVTWRGKTYVGALLDCTRHDWAPPRLCDSPASDIDSKAHKGVRTKRIVTRSNGVGLDEKNLLQTTGKLRNGKGRRILTPNDPVSCNKRQRDSDRPVENIAAQIEAKGSSANVSSMTNGDTVSVPMNVDIPQADNNTESISTTDNLTEKTGPNSPMLIGCKEPNCSKKYRNINGLQYHQAHAHGNDNDLNNAQEGNYSSQNKEATVSKSPNKNSETNMDVKEEPISEASDHQSPCLNIKPQDSTDQNQTAQMRHRVVSPSATQKIHHNSVDSAPTNISNNGNALLNQNTRTHPNSLRNTDFERRTSSSSIHNSSNLDHGNRGSPSISSGNSRGQPEFMPGSNNHCAQKSNIPKQATIPPPLPATTEEGMKPSGTSTGPPPAPHQANCFFNNSFLTGGNYNPFNMPYLPRPPPMPMYDSITPPTSNANAFLRLMNSMRVPPIPEPPSRLLSPSMSKNLPPFQPGPPLPVPVPTSQMANPPLPNMPPMTNTSMASGSPHLRMPSQVDQMMPPNPFPPAGLNPALGLPGPLHMGPLGPPVPSLLDDHLAKQFPRRFN